MEGTPDNIANEQELDERLTRPRAVLVDFMRTVANPLVILGAGGKMGPTLAVLARRAADVSGHVLRIIAVSRFSDERTRHWLESHGIETHSADLLDRQAVTQLPESTNVIYLVGLKFGTTQKPEQTWAVNTLIPAYVAERYSAARIVALSTGNVYPLTAVQRGGSVETDPLTR